MIRLGRTYDNYILFIIFIKILFIICAISTFLLKMKIKMSKNNNNKIINMYNNLSDYKETLEFIFIISTAFIVLLYFIHFIKNK